MAETTLHSQHDIEVLLHHRANVFPWPQGETIAYSESMIKWIALGFLVENNSCTGHGLTELGKKFVNKLLNTSALSLEEQQ